MRLQRVEDLECWREARILVNIVFKKSNGRLFRRDTQLRSHVTGASLDVMNCLTEGYEARSDSEFVRQLRFAMRSISEVQTTLYAALDLKYITKNDFMGLHDQMQKTRKLIEGFRQYLSGRQSGRQGRRWTGRRGGQGGRNPQSASPVERHEAPRPGPSGKESHNLPVQ